MQSPVNDSVDALAFTLMLDLVAISGDRWVSASRFTEMLDSWNLRDPVTRIRFLTGVLQLLRGMPVQVFAGLDARQAILQAGQEALDSAIEADEDFG